jgi:hypothetical protein
MPRYCKAYKIEDLRKFPKWAESAKSNEKELEDGTLVYIKEELTVTSDCLDLDNEEKLILTDVTPEWEAFCKDELKFEVPDWEAEAARVREQLAKEEKEKEEAEKKEGE